jgi:3'-5' exoribonuclease
MDVGFRNHCPGPAGFLRREEYCFASTRLPANSVGLPRNSIEVYIADDLFSRPGTCKLGPVSLSSRENCDHRLHRHQESPGRPAMPRRYVNELTHQEAVDEVFVANDKQLRPNRNGNLYLQVELSDRTGSIATRLWNANESLYRSFENGQYVRVTGTAQQFQGAMQIIATKIRKVEPGELDEADFVPVPAVPVDKLVHRLSEILREISDPALRSLAECFLMDDAFMARFALAPAGTKNHHAYHGGLLDHVVNLMEVVLRVSPCYPQINRDLLLMGAFLHDMGKVHELQYERGLSYSDEGQLIGHLVMAVSMLEAKVAEAEKLSGDAIPMETVLRLKHMIVSHHGEYAFGSPKLPMTLEALALCYLDNLDAKINSFAELMHEDPNVDSPWTTFNPHLERKLFKGTAAEGRTTEKDADETSSS